MVAAKSPFASWQSELARLGFARLGTGGRKGTYLGRQAGPLQQAIGILVSDDRQGAFNVQLNINMPLRCAEPPHDVVILEGDLTANGITIREPWVHDPVLTTWWQPEKIAEAWAAFRHRGLEWLDRYASLATLARHFETELERYRRARTRKPSWLAVLGRRLGITDPPPRTREDGYLLWLSMLYEEQGDLRGAGATRALRRRGSDSGHDPEGHGANRAASPGSGGGSRLPAGRPGLRDTSGRSRVREGLRDDIPGIPPRQIGESARRRGRDHRVTSEEGASRVREAEFGRP